jgi:hypothetical protein
MTDPGGIGSSSSTTASAARVTRLDGAAAFRVGAADFAALFFGRGFAGRVLDMH